MIPKKIHYCWFGGNPLPELAKKCIESWKKYCPEYEIIEWNETNFNVSECRYAQEAFKAKKWAFVSDYARLKVLVEYGGIYMDTDVEVLRSLDRFLEHQAFSGFENADAVPTGIMACEKGFKLFSELLNEYHDRSFIKEDGSMDMSTNVEAITKTCLSKGLELNNTFQIVDGFALYPKNVFCPKNYENGLIELTDDTYTIHHFSGSWLSGRKVFWRNLSYRIIKKMGPEKGHRFLRSLFMRMLEALVSEGIVFAFKRLKLKLKMQK